MSLVLAVAEKSIKNAADSSEILRGSSKQNIFKFIEICPLDFDRSTAKTAFLSSITHFRIKVGEKHFTLLEKYRQDRIRDLKRQDAFNPFRR